MRPLKPHSRWFTGPLGSVVWAATIVTLLGFATACGISTNDGVEILAAEGHEELLDGTTPTTEPPPELVGAQTRTVNLYFIGIDSKLEVVERPIPLPVTGTKLLGALEGGPLPNEVLTFEELGILTTLLPIGIEGSFAERNEDTGVQRVNVNPEAELVLVAPDTLRIIASQIVCTVLALNQPNISGVEIFEGEEAIPLTDSNAEPIQGAADIDDFDGCKTGTDERAELASTSTTEQP